MRIPRSSLRWVVGGLLAAPVSFAVDPVPRTDLKLPLGNRDRVTGHLRHGADKDTFEIACPAGSVLAVTAKSSRVAAGMPAGPLRVQVRDTNGVLLQARDGTGTPYDADATTARVSLKGIAVPTTAVYRVEVRSGDSDPSRETGYTIAASWKTRRKWREPALAAAPGTPGLLRFSAPAGALVSLDAKSAGNSAPSFGRVRENGLPTGVDLTGVVGRNRRFTASHTADFDVEVVVTATGSVSATASVTPAARKPSRLDTSDFPAQASVFVIDDDQDAVLDPAIDDIAGFLATIPADTFPQGTSVIIGPGVPIPPAGDFLPAGPAVSITATEKFRPGAIVDLTLPFDPAEANGDSANLVVTVRDDEGRVSDEPLGSAADLGSGKLDYPASHFSTYQVSARTVPRSITTIAGDGVAAYAGDGGPARAASLNGPDGIAVDAAGNIYIADQLNNRVRRIDPSGTMTTFAGNGTGGYSGDGGPATAASVNSPTGVAVDTAGNVFIVQYDGQRVQKVDRTGTITTVAGNGTGGYSGDGGPATAAQLLYPTGVAVDRAGRIYIADYYNHRVRKVDTEGTITTLAGDGTEAFSGDGGPATAAQMGYPAGVAVDDAGNVFISADRRIRKVDVAGRITSIAGNPAGVDTTEPGPAASARLFLPWGLAFDGSGNLLVTELDRHRVRRISKSGIITLIAGSGPEGFTGDGGPATAATLGLPWSVAADATGSIYVTDGVHHRIRRVSR